MKGMELQQVKQRYGIVGNHEGLSHALNVALQVAPTDLSVLVVGESGSGKEVFARIIHDCSPRRREKYFAVNCGSIPEGTIDSELFGHEKGSFTGAIGESDGYFGTANKGTIFLDEVGELPMATQARLLRVLETGEYIRVGGQAVRKTDVRIVAATNVNMRKAISEGRFREDLYYRLCTIPIQVPPLRDRGDDIVLLFRLFAMQMAEKYRLPKVTLTDDARAMLLHYKWPGNVRELKNVTERLSILSPERQVSAKILRQFIPEDQESTMLAPLPTGNRSYESERELLFKVLYELRGQVGDLRRELNGLRERLDRPAADWGTATYGTPSVAPRQGTIQDADAEEIREEREAETLNLQTLEQQTLIKALERHGGNHRMVAAELGISPRTLYRRLKEVKKGE